MAGINSAIRKKSIGNHINCVNIAIKGSFILKIKTRVKKQMYPSTHKHTIKNGFPAKSSNKSLNIII